MTLDIVKLQTTWNDAAGSINSNYAKIADAIAQLKANGGGGGGGADIDLTDYASKVWVEAQGYITASALTPYLKTEDAKETYATKDFVNNKLINYATIGSVTAIQNTLTGQIGAVNASVEQLAATKLDSSYFTLTNIKSTLGISDWALEATKPSYAWSEITSRPTALSQFTDDVVAGKYLPLSGGTINGTSVQPLYLKNKQSNCGILFFNNTDNATLMYSGGSNWRVTDNGWSNVYYLLHSGNIGNYNAGSATKLLHRRKLWGNDFDGTKDVSGQMYVGEDFFIEHSTTGRQLHIHPNWTILGYNNPMIGNPTYIDGRNVYIRYGNDEYTSVFASSGNVGIGNPSPTEKLDVSGNIKADGNINATSITINGVTITASNGTITVNGNVFAKGDITGGV